MEHLTFYRDDGDATGAPAGGVAQTFVRRPKPQLGDGGVLMQPLPISLVGQACRIFMDLAYPQGRDSIPAHRLAFYDLPPDGPLEDFLPPALAAAGVVQPILGEESQIVGYAFRLGSAQFPHLKMRVQPVEYGGQQVCVFMVDTHDGFSKETRVPPADHPDAAQWLALQSANRQLKERIEAAWAARGLATLNSLLRQDLQGGPPA